MGSINKAILCGNIGTEPKVTTTQNGNKCAMFTLATSEPAYTLQNGTQVPEKTEWHNIVCWGGLASVVEAKLGKGMQVNVIGKIRTRKYQDQQTNADKWITEVVAEELCLLRGNTKPAQQQPAPAPQYAAPAPAASGNNDDMPF